MKQELLQKKDEEEDEGLISNPLRLFSAQSIDTDASDLKLRQFYVKTT